MGLFQAVIYVGTAYVLSELVIRNIDTLSKLSYVPTWVSVYLQTLHTHRERLILFFLVLLIALF